MGEELKRASSEQNGRGDRDGMAFLQLRKGGRGMQEWMRDCWWPALWAAALTGTGLQTRARKPLKTSPREGGDGRA